MPLAGLALLLLQSPELTADRAPSDLVAMAELDRMFTPGDEQTTLLEDAPADLPPPRAKTPPPFGTRESTRINVYLGGGLEPSEHHNATYLAGVSFSRFIAEDLSLDLGFNGLFFDQKGTNAGAPNVVLLMRWHLLAADHWSLYADGGAGLMWATADVPSAGSKFNFTPQAGAGVSFDVGGDARMLIGARWHHISNGSLDSTNPGRDSVIAYAGLSLPF